MFTEPDQSKAAAPNRRPTPRTFLGTSNTFPGNPVALEFQLFKYYNYSLLQTHQFEAVFLSPYSDQNSNHNLCATALPGRTGFSSHPETGEVQFMDLSPALVLAVEQLACEPMNAATLAERVCDALQVTLQKDILLSMLPFLNRALDKKLILGFQPS